MKFKVPLLILSLLVSQLAYSWNSSGHQIIAAITWDLLSEEQQTYWVDVIKHHPRFQQDFLKNKPRDVSKNPEYENEWIFRQASIWPDVVRGLPKKQLNLFHHGSWHYVNTPIYLNNTFNTDHINTDHEFHGSFHNGINVIQATLGHIKTMEKQGVTKKHQAFALSWLMHLVGDSHQPMHCSSLFSETYFPNGDKGGNDIPIMGQGQAKNLHRFWDSTLHNSTSFSVISRKALIIQEKLATNKDSYQARSVSEWMNDCYQVAKSKAYTPMMLQKIRYHENSNNPIPKIFISEVYAQQARSVAELQALNAALQMKSILDSIPMK